MSRTLVAARRASHGMLTTLESSLMLTGRRRHEQLPREGQLETVRGRFDDVAHGPIRECP